MFRLTNPMAMSCTPLRPLCNILSGVLLTASIPVQGQFQMEHVYPGGSFSLAAPNQMFANQLFLLELDVSGWKYVHIDRVARQVDLYQLDHTFWKSVSFNMTTALNPYAQTHDILYITEHLFDLDDGIEFLYTNTYFNGMDPPTCVTQIVDEENAGLIFNVSGQYPSVKPNWHMQQYPIQTTPVGTKLILSAIESDSAYVYGLPGELSTQLVDSWGRTSAMEGMSLFPNPAGTEVTVQLSPRLAGASMDIVSSDGQVVRTLFVQGTTTTIDIRELACGRYFCHIQGEQGRLSVGSFIKG